MLYARYLAFGREILGLGSGYNCLIEVTRLIVVQKPLILPGCGLLRRPEFPTTLYTDLLVPGHVAVQAPSVFRILASITSAVADITIACKCHSIKIASTGNPGTLFTHPGSAGSLQSDS